MNNDKFHNRLMVFGDTLTIKKIFNLIKNNMNKSDTIDFNKLLNFNHYQNNIIIEKLDYNHNLDEPAIKDDVDFKGLYLNIISRHQPLNEQLFNDLKNQFDLAYCFIYFKIVDDFDHDQIVCGGKFNYGGIEFEDQQTVNNRFELMKFLEWFENQSVEIINSAINN